MAVHVWHFTVKNVPTTVIQKEQSDGSWLIDVKRNGKLEHTEGPFKAKEDALREAFILIERMKGEDQ